MRANLTWITEDLAVGGDLSLDTVVEHEQALDIIGQGVTQIIDMRSEAQDHVLWEQHGIRYEWHGTDDAHGHSIPAEVFDGVVLAARREFKRGGKVFVHCHMGVNRGPSGGFAILLDRGMDPIPAFDLIRSKRRQAFVAYAMDALDAHHNRRLREKNLGFHAAAERDALEKHLRRVHTTQEILRVNRLISEHYEEDETAIIRTHRMRH